MNLKKESLRATELTKGKVISVVRRYRKKEVMVEFTDGSRLFVDHLPDRLDLSITEGRMVRKENRSKVK